VGGSGVTPLLNNPLLALLLAFGTSSWALGVVLVRRSRRNVARTRRMRGTRTSRISALARDSHRRGIVEIVGRVLAGTDGTFTAPLSGKQVVYCRLHWESARSATDWDRRGCAVRGLRFHLEDASPATARILPNRLAVPELLKHRTVAASASESAHAFYEAHRIETAADRTGPEHVDTSTIIESGRESGEMLAVNDVRWIEETLVPGDRVYIIGPMRAAGPGVIELYAGAGDDEELLLATGNEKAFAERMLLDRKLGMIAVAVGLAAYLVLLLVAGAST
jgi:hypothetical protein